MTEENQNVFANEAPRYWSNGLSVFPIALGKKGPPQTEDSKQWTSFCCNLPSEKKRQLLLKKYSDQGIGLLLGKEVITGSRIAAIDVDDGKLVPLVRTILGKHPSAKRGKKGETIFVLADLPLKSTSLRDASGKGKIDILIVGKLTVIPPSIHPDTGEPYTWIGLPLLECTMDQLPIFTQAKLDLLRRIVQFKHLDALLAGVTTHDAGLSLSATLVSAGCDERLIHNIFKALLPENYIGNTLEELQGWIDSAKEKGYDLSVGGPLDERIAKATEQQLSPLVYVQGEGFLHYSNGRWQKLSDSAFDRKAKELALPFLRQTQQVGSLLTNIRKCAALNLEREKFGEYSSKICLKNGTLDVETGELLKWSPEHEIRYQLDFDYDPTARCPVYEEQIRVTLRDDERAIAAFEEFAGLTFVPNLKFQKALYFIGPAGCGKSTLLKAVESLHSPEAVSVTPLDKIDNERYLTDLAGKLVCISFDTQTEKRVFGEAWVRITGGDLIATRKLYSEVEGRVKPTVRFMGSMNPDMPRFIASPDALERRLIFLQCGEKVENPDPNRQTLLYGERAGIFNRWVLALRRLIERGRFDLPAKSLDTVNEYVSTQDPVQVFIADMLIVDANAHTPISDLTKIYNGWAGLTNERALSSNTLGRKLKAAGLKFSHHKSDNGKSLRTYGARPKFPYDEY